MYKTPEKWEEIENEKKANGAWAEFLESRNKKASLMHWFWFAMFVFFMLLSTCALASEYTNDQIADAIYLIEGGKETRFPYGIMSVKCSGEKECRKICINTIRNNRKRYKAYGYKKYSTYLEFLGSRYCPPDDHPMNKNWLPNLLNKLGE